MNTYNQYLTIVEQALDSIPYPEEHKGLYEPIRYTLACGGKRLRPVLTLAAAEACGLPAERAIDMAVGVEMFHNFTLLHDDIMDRADMRRGRATVHRKWGNAAAILSGDAMLTAAAIMIGRCADSETSVRASQLFHSTAMEVYQGQQDDMEFEQRDDVTVEEYMVMIRLKTGALIAGAMGLGAIAAGADDRTVALMRAYGYELGLAFQLKDDLLDTYGDPIVFGKEIGGDIVNDKKTWLNITALAEDTAGIVLSQVKAPSEPAVKIETVRRVYDSLSLPERCTALMEEHMNKACDHIRTAGLKPAATQFFESLAHDMCKRNH